MRLHYCIVADQCTILDLTRSCRDFVEKVVSLSTDFKSSCHPSCSCVQIIQASVKTFPHQKILKASPLSENLRFSAPQTIWTMMAGHSLLPMCFGLMVKQASHGTKKTCDTFFFSWFRLRSPQFILSHLQRHLDQLNSLRFGHETPRSYPKVGRGLGNLCDFKSIYFWRYEKFLNTEALESGDENERRYSVKSLIFSATYQLSQLSCWSSRKGSLWCFFAM